MDLAKLRQNVVKVKEAIEPAKTLLDKISEEACASCPQLSNELPRLFNELKGHLIDIHVASNNAKEAMDERPPIGARRGGGRRY
jgi:hypothetical protein